MTGGSICPQCGAEAGAALPGLPVVTCASCQALLLLDAGKVRAVGDSGRMPFDVSPLQLGTTLEVDGHRGEIVGRERWRWDRGSWNEWLLYLANGGQRWVAEETGLYMVMDEIELSPDERQQLAAIDQADNAALGQTVQVGKTVYTVSDIKTVHCVASEGHLPEVVPAAFARESIDFRRRDGRALTWQSDARGSSCWAGRYYTLAELSPARLRTMDGWQRPGFAIA